MCACVCMCFFVIILFKHEIDFVFHHYFHIKMISNINYVGKVLDSTTHLTFRPSPPYMHVYKCEKYTLVIFKCGKCRLMGCKRPLTTKVLDDGPVRVSIVRIQSVSVTFDVGARLSLNQLGNFCHRQSLQYLYEPELFPALRLSTFDPLCVNVFASGKCVIFGLKHLCYHKFVKRVTHLINRSGCMYQPSSLENAKSIRENDIATVERNTTKTEGICQVERDNTKTTTTTKTSTGQWSGQKEEDKNEEDIDFTTTTTTTTIKNCCCYN